MYLTRNKWYLAGNQGYCCLMICDSTAVPLRPHAKHTSLSAVVRFDGHKPLVLT